MPIRPDDLYRTPNALAPHYSRFRVAERLLLTGHSHQAWPDRGHAGQMRAWDDAAELVDKKWDRAFAMAERVRAGFAHLLDDTQGAYTLGANTHELVVRFLSALPLGERPRLVSTDGEFYSIRRQLDRLEEEGSIEIVRVPAAQPEQLAERLIAAVDERTAAVLVSAVLFRNARLVGGLAQVLEAARRSGAELLVDTYHALAALPYSLRQEGLEEAFVVGGGYKYCQLGEGNCFLRLPADCTMRPLITGWFAEFGALESVPGPRVAYGPGPWRFAGATYDPTSHYRAAAVFDFFEETGLEPALLRRISQHQVRLLAHGFDDLDLDPRLVRRDTAIDLARVGGFLVLETGRAAELVGELRRRGVATDCRGDQLRLGPAPYLSDSQLRDAVALLGEAARSL